MTTSNSISIYTTLTDVTRSFKTPDPDADLAAVVTTTGKAASGSPFHGHRIAQIAPGVSLIPGTKGDLYAQAKPEDGLRPLRASFEFLVSEEVRDLARELFRREQPEHFARLRSPDRSAMAFVLRRLKLRRWIFQGNEIGVHLGMLGEPTLEALRSGRSRPTNARPLLDWSQVVSVWSRRFLRLQSSWEKAPTRGPRGSIGKRDKSA